MGADGQGGGAAIGRRRLTWWKVTAAVAAAVAVLIVLALPPRRLTLPAIADGSIPGTLHIHTNRSDGLSGPDEVAAAAARAGLKFIVFTDHGDATRTLDPPMYRSGVLCLDGVEISTTGGHYAAIDMRTSPYPLGGEPRDVVDDVRRLGGFGIAAHPDSPKRELRWSDWSAPFDAIELLNPDTSWRVWADEARSARPGAVVSPWTARRRIAEALVGYPFRPAETIASLTRPPGEVVSQWAALAERRRVVTIAGIDAHAKLTLRGDPGDEDRYTIPVPGYLPSFRTLSVHITPDRALTGTAAVDAATVMRAIRNGHLYVAVDGIATPPSFDFTATNEHGTVHEGDEIAAGGPLRLRVRSNAPPEFMPIVWNGATIVSSERRAPEFTIETAGGPAVYWVEFRSLASGGPRTWLRSNPIYVRSSEPTSQPSSRPPATSSHPLIDATTAAACHVENNPTSVASLDTTAAAAGELGLRFVLSGGPPGSGQVAAIVCDTTEDRTPADRVTFTGRADRPMRISVQVRGREGEATGERWQRSSYVDTFGQERTLYFDDFTPIGVTHTAKPPFSGLRSILFVVDTTNTKPGASGRLWIKSAALQQ